MAKPTNIKRCVFNCQNSRRLFSFPNQVDFTKLWLKILGLEGKPLCRSEMYVCLNHFSARQLSDNGKSITPTSIPDKNLPVKNNLPPSEIEVFQNVKKPICAPNIPCDKKKYKMITSESSKCYLKCKTYNTLHRFPRDLTSFNIWIEKIGLPENTKLIRTASLCDNHFSPAMRCLKTITRCAVPDIYLPPQCTFINEFQVVEESIIEPSCNVITSNSCSQPVNIEKLITDEPILDSSFISSDSNSQQSVVLAQPTPVQNEGNSHAFEHSFKPISDPIVPEKSGNALYECVLKCKAKKVLYRFPNAEARRQLWLRQIGLTHCFYNTSICNRHFSEKMISKQTDRLKHWAFPDINLPEAEQLRTAVALSTFKDKALELPQYICVLTVFTHSTNINSMLSTETKYVKYTVDQNVPKRERSVQVEELIGKVNVSILADDDFDDEELDVVENINFEQQPDLINEMLNTHVFPSNTNDMFECLKCGEISLDQESNRRHLDSHREFSCLCFYCGRKFINGVKLKIHEMKEHRIEIKQLLRCPKEHCKKAFYSRKNLGQHLNEHSRPTKYFCSYCRRLFYSSLKLKCHLLICRPKNIRSRIKSY